MARARFDQTGIGQTVQLGKEGSKIKSTATDVIEVLNHAEDGLAILRAAPPIDDNDLVTKKYLETRADAKVSGQINGGSPPAAGTSGRLFVCTTAGGTFTLGRLYWDTGSSWEEIIPVAGMTIAVTTALTGGTITFEDDSKYIWDADTTAWKFVGSASTAEGVQGVISTLVFGDTGVQLLKAVPGNALVTKILISVTQVFNGTSPTLIIGDTSDPDRLVKEEYVDLESLGVYEIVPAYYYGALTEVNTTLTIGGSPTTGQATVYMEYIKQ